MLVMKKFTFYIILIFVSCSEGTDESEVVVPNPDPDPEPTVEAFKKIVSDNYSSNSFKFGATLNNYQLNTNVEELFLKEFTYTTPENSFKQTIVHPEPGVWNWDRVDAFLDFAKSKNIEVRAHGPIGPQSSKWAKEVGRKLEGGKNEL